MDKIEKRLTKQNQSTAHSKIMDKSSEAATKILFNETKDYSTFKNKIVNYRF